MGNFPGGPGVHDSTLPLQGGTGSIPGLETRIPHAMWHRKKKKKRKRFKWKNEVLELLQELIEEFLNITLV